MTNKLFIKKINEEYFLSKSVEDKKNLTKCEPILEKGTLPELLYSLATISDGFYKEGVKVNYGREHLIIKIPEHTKDAINNFVRTLERIASEKFLSK
jgi:hypothetical protein